MKKTIFIATALFLLTITTTTLISCNGGEPSREEKIEEMIAKIKTTPEWIAKIKEEAAAKQQPIDSLIKTAAAYTIDVETNKTKSREERMKDMVQKINNTPDWIANIKKDATEKKQPLDSLINLAAIWMIDDQDGKHK